MDSKMSSMDMIQSKVKCNKFKHVERMTSFHMLRAVPSFSNCSRRSLNTQELNQFYLWSSIPHLISITV